ncbi:TPA: cytosolic protein [Bacillus cereus]
MKKKPAITILASTETFQNLSTFQTVEEMNQTARHYRDRIRTSVTRSDVQGKLLALLELLKHHSCTYIGVSFLCKNSIAAFLHVSYKTVQRLMKKLVDLQIIRQLPMKRKSDMRQTSNVVLIQPHTEDLSDKDSIKNPVNCPTKKTKSISLKQKSKNINKRKEDVSQSVQQDVDFIDYRVPLSMRMKLQHAFDSHVMTESFQNAVNIAKKASKQCTLLADTTVFHNLLANASSVLVSKTHKYEHNSTLMKNPIGYFTRTFKQMVYNYIDSFRDIHNLAKRQQDTSISFAIFQQCIDG